MCLGQEIIAGHTPTHKHTHTHTHTHTYTITKSIINVHNQNSPFHCLSVFATVNYLSIIWSPLVRCPQLHTYTHIQPHTHTHMNTYSCMVITNSLYMCGFFNHKRCMFLGTISLYLYSSPCVRFSVFINSHLLCFLVHLKDTVFPYDRPVVHVQCMWSIVGPLTRTCSIYM